MTHAEKSEAGVVLAMVLVLALVLSAAVVTFARRAVIDTMIVRNREKVAGAEALARSGIHIAKAVLVEQFQRKIDVASDHNELESEEIVGNTLVDLWARVGDYDLITPEGAILRVSIFDNRSRLNLNSMVRYVLPKKKKDSDQDDKPKKAWERQVEELGIGQPDQAGEEPDTASGKPIDDAEEFLVDFFDRIIENMHATAEEKEYDSRELARSLLDYLDTDTVGIDGGDEDDYYQSQEPPYWPANRPLLSVQELGLVEGFDPTLVEAIQPYVTVYPLLRGRGVNLNTAPPHVIGSLYHGAGGNRGLFSEDDVMQVLNTLEDGSVFCDKTEADPDRCITMEQADLEGGLYPPTELPVVSFTYTVISEVQYGDIERSIEAVLAITSPGQPRLLFWRMQ